MISVQTSAATLDRFGHYELRGALGEGGYGRVYEAWDPTLHRAVALKCLKTSTHHAAPDALIDEARRAASLRHRAFVKIFAFEECDDLQAIVMELVPGSTLRSSIERHIPDAAQALDIIDQVAEAMAEAHQVGLIHGDIKPTNLMLEPSGAVRILDFGLARKVDPLATDVTTTQDHAATVANTAPERMMGCPLSRGSDIYSLGVVLYEFLTGERPFATLTGLALAAAHVHTTSDSWPFPVSTDRSLVELVRKMTAHDPARRLASMEAMRERIAALRETAGNGAATHAPAQREAAPRPESQPEPISTQSQSTTPPTFLQRWRWPMIATATASAAAAALLVLPPLEQWIGKLAPYSESQAMAAGLEKLSQADRDGALEQAVQSFDSMLERNPRHAAATAGASIAYSMRYLGDGRDENWRRFAEAGAQTALKEDDHLVLAHAAQAWALTLKGDRPAALAAADRALALDPLDMSALNAKLVLLLDVCKGKWPKERMCYDIEGTMHHRRGDYAGAVWATCCSRAGTTPAPRTRSSKPPPERAAARTRR